MELFLSHGLKCEVQFYMQLIKEKLTQIRNLSDLNGTNKHLMNNLMLNLMIKQLFAGKSVFSETNLFEISSFYSVKKTFRNISSRSLLST